MRHAFAFVLSLWAGVLCAEPWEARKLFGPEDAGRVLRVLSSTDIALFAPVLESFVALNPDVAVDYAVASTAQIDRVMRDAPDAFDLAVSSAMDLQFKLANDGFARAVEGFAYPDWATWRRSVFAFTSEPAAIVVNRAAFAATGLPLSRQNLIRILRSQPEAFRGKVGTYDVRQSGLGYLFATQDARTSETYWRLMEVMGNLDAQLYCCSSEMIEDVASGRLAVAYNVLGSYAQARSDLADRIEVILPSDFQTVMMRTALVSNETTQPDLARAFLIHLLTWRSAPSLPMLDLDRSASEQSTIQLEPALLTYLDRLKALRFIAAWEDAVIQ
jgi:iron(III) transport system substrate-binding protein